MYDQMKAKQMPTMVVAPHPYVAPHRFGGDPDHGHRMHGSERDYTKEGYEEPGNTQD